MTSQRQRAMDLLTYLLSTLDYTTITLAVMIEEELMNDPFDADLVTSLRGKHETVKLARQMIKDARHV